MVKPTTFDIVAVKIPHPNNNWAIKTIADFLPQRSEMRPAPNVPTANPAKNSIFATTKINIKFLGNIKRQIKFLYGKSNGQIYVIQLPDKLDESHTRLNCEIKVSCQNVWSNPNSLQPDAQSKETFWLVRVPWGNVSSV